MTQQDRSHKIAAEQQLGQVQNQNLAEKFQITQEDRHNQLETESRMGQIKVQTCKANLVPSCTTRKLQPGEARLSATI